MTSKAGLATVPIVLALASAANAQMMPGAPSQPLGPVVGDQPPPVTLTVRGAFGTPSEDWAFDNHWIAPDEGRNLFVVRRLDLTTSAVRWATSDTCEGLDEIMAELNALPSPSVWIPGVYRATPPMAPPADGVFFHLKVRFGEWPRRANAFDISFGGNLGSPLAEWHEALTQVTADCWSDEPPDL